MQTRPSPTTKLTGKNNMDTYQPIYDAVRSKLSGCDVGAAISSEIRNMNLSHYAEMAKECFREAVNDYGRPSVFMRPKIYKDGNMWLCLYGDNIQEGVCGFGETPDKATHEFDAEWYGWKKANGGGV